MTDGAAYVGRVPCAIDFGGRAANWEAASLMEIARATHFETTYTSLEADIWGVRQ
jgi:hypothetical protein